MVMMTAARSELSTPDERNRKPVPINPNSYVRCNVMHSYKWTLYGKVFVDGFEGRAGRQTGLSDE
jgi:hypothetical protein